jgi:hypothetical protein
MNSPLIALVSAGCIFSGALLGLGLQSLLPNHHLSKETQDIVKLSAGTIATLTALVLGLLVSSAKSSFDTVNKGVVQGSVKIILLDRALARYGQETKSVREQLKHAIAAGIEMIWPTGKTGASGFTAFERAKSMELVQENLSELTPQNNTQRQALARAQQILGELNQNRLLLIEQEQNQLPLSLVLILVFWLSLIFVSFGLFAPSNVTALTVLFLGACAISAAIFLVLDLDRPLEGFIKVSSNPLRDALAHLDQ